MLGDSVRVVCKVDLDVGITFWQAVKLRIAGRAYLPIAEKIGNVIVEQIKANTKTI